MPKWSAALRWGKISTHPITYSVTYRGQVATVRGDQVAPGKLRTYTATVGGRTHTSTDMVAEIHWAEAQLTSAAPPR